MPDNLRCLATLPQLRIRQTLKNADSSDDQRLLAKLRAASNEIEHFTSKNFQPVIETRTFDWESITHLQFRSQTALQITSITDGAGQVLSGTAIVPLGGTTSTLGTSVGPFYGIEAIPTLGGYFFYVLTKKRCMAVAGTWGWHNDYANAFVNSGVTVQSNPLTAGATSILTSTNDGTVTDAYGRNWVVTLPVPASYGTVHVGHLIQIDTEWMQVVAVPDATHLTVVRGVNGSTAASHLQNAAIQLYNVPTDVNDICITWAARLYYQDSTGSSGSASIKPFGRGVKTPPDPMGDLKERLMFAFGARVA